MLGRVVVSRRPEVVSIEVDGLVSAGRDDTDGDVARQHRGGGETHRLTPTPDGTRLAIAADTGEEHDDMSAAWDRALVAVQQLARTSPATAP